MSFHSNKYLMILRCRLDKKLLGCLIKSIFNTIEGQFCYGVPCFCAENEILLIH